MGKPGFKLLLGGLAGFIAWAIMEPGAPANIASSESAIWQQRFVLLLGVTIGLVLGGYNGFLQGSRTHLVRGLLLGGLLGAIGVSLGTGIGSSVIGASGNNVLLTGPLFLRIPIRMIALTPIGTFLGAGIGASSLNRRRALQGAIGGTIGAGIGSLFFDPVSELLQVFTLNLKHVQPGQIAETGIFGRALFCILLGAGIGFFIGLVEQVSKVAWLRLVLGRNEGKEWAVDATHTHIGRSETAHVPLFGDHSISPQHAVITRQGSQYVLSDHGSQTGTFLNGYPVSQPTPLFHGAVLQVGTYRLEFLMKEGTAPQRAAEMLRSQHSYQMQPQIPPAVPFAPNVGFAAAGGPQMGGPMQQANVMPPTSVPTQVFAAQSVAPQSAPVFAVAVAGPLTGQRFPLQSMLEAGRGTPGINLAFDAGASRRHASFTPTPNGIVLTDLGSTNGTYVNDQQVQTAILNKGDLVRIGATTFRLE